MKENKRWYIYKIKIEVEFRKICFAQFELDVFLRKLFLPCQYDFEFSENFIVLYYLMLKLFFF